MNLFHTLQSKMLSAGLVCSTYSSCTWLPSTMQERILSSLLYSFRPAVCVGQHVEEFMVKNWSKHARAVLWPSC